LHAITLQGRDRKQRVLSAGRVDRTLVRALSETGTVRGNKAGDALQMGVVPCPTTGLLVGTMLLADH